MDDAAERYLDELRRNLRPLPEEERSDAVREIESHIAEGQADGRPTAAVLAGLGDARTLARARGGLPHPGAARRGAWIGGAFRPLLGLRVGDGPAEPLRRPHAGAAHRR